MKTTAHGIVNSRDVENMYHFRLMVLLQELVRKKGYEGAARVLEIDQRTVAKSAKSGQFTHRVREALERALQEGGGSAADRQRKRNEKLDAQLKELKEELRGGLKGLNRLEGQLDKLERQVGELRETLPSGLRRLRMSLDGVRKYYGVQRRLFEQRLSALEVGQRMTENEASAGGESVDPGSRSVAAWSAHTKGRGYPWEPAGAETEADAAEEMQIIVSVKGGKATIGVHQPSSAPYIETFDDADLSDLGKDVAMATERARATWEAAPIIALRAPSSPGPAS